MFQNRMRMTRVIKTKNMMLEIPLINKVRVKLIINLSILMKKLSDLNMEKKKEINSIILHQLTI